MSGYFDIAAASQFLCRSPRWLRGKLTEIPHYRLSGQVLFSEEDLRKWMQQFRVEPKQIDLRALLERAGISKGRRPAVRKGSSQGTKKLTPQAPAVVAVSLPERGGE